MIRLISNLIGIAILIFIISLFTDPTNLARDIGKVSGEAASAFIDGFSNGSE